MYCFNVLSSCWNGFVLISKFHFDQIVEINSTISIGLEKRLIFISIPLYQLLGRPPSEFFSLFLLPSSSVILFVCVFVLQLCRHFLASGSSLETQLSGPPSIVSLCCPSPRPYFESLRLVCALIFDARIPTAISFTLNFTSLILIFLYFEVHLLITSTTFTLHTFSFYVHDLHYLVFLQIRPHLHLDFLPTFYCLDSHITTFYHDHH